MQKSNKVVEIESNLEHSVAELICVDCHFRYISVWPTKTLLKDLECPSCKKVGMLIKTGQDLPEEEELLYEREGIKNGGTIIKGSFEQDK